MRSEYAGVSLVVVSIGVCSAAIVADSPGLMILVWMVMGTAALFVPLFW